MKTPTNPRDLINWWLDHINEQDPECRHEVIHACESNKESRMFYVELAKKCLTEYLQANTLTKTF